MLKRITTPFLLLSGVMAILALLLGAFMMSKPTLAANPDNNGYPRLSSPASMMMTKTMPGGMGMMGAIMPMTGTMPMHQMHRQMSMMGRHMQMMGQMMQMMGEMHSMMNGGMGMMEGKMPITATMPMSGAMSMGDMQMGRHMQMMGQMMQMMGEMQDMMGAGMMDGNMMDCMAMMKQMHGSTMGAGMMGSGTDAPAQATPKTDTASPMTQTAQLDNIAVSVWPLNLTRTDANTIDFFVKLETHSGDLNFDLAKLAMLRVSETELAASAWQPSAPSGHHITGTLSFPAYDKNGKSILAEATEIALVLRNLGGHPEHVFQWDLR